MRPELYVTAAALSASLTVLGSMIDLARWTTGEIARVCAHLNTFVERPGPEGEARFEDVTELAVRLLALKGHQVD